ncbi:hypothetical protein CRG98_034908 [Punica granatum]|uniref:Uncharacterized protein n=1 Tax=Punica granatum TaxID=22663 RepID=A0A2I0IL63_PUNGR|nr:hypothetical protein CRG98_034908 [Punica granatum]
MKPGANEHIGCPREAVASQPSAAKDHLTRRRLEGGGPADGPPPGNGYVNDTLPFRQTF